MQNHTFRASTRLRTLATVVAFAAATAVSFSAHAADAAAGPVTHASLMKELSELRAVGYDLFDDNFPESLQRAERKLEAKRRAQEQGIAVQGSSAS
ncbi:DUF4148 domain-containing protein [Cupriavidus plantarum]|uniref:Uncharacterized protein DUF4148 n=1 Tax=Cupriavidus plantarum TaxID=942865 RepID=A0A316FF04_9BURK|nr:DUF4148 domain-containing protein [Cupriavidus plantarum]PWK36220.1 uncharacterized protein DUF4148 [Cupriavidus plantarum]